MRNPVITILKALAIILVVMAHSGCPTYLSRFAYMLCVSLFFMASGYCFNTKYLNEEAAFVKRRFKSLYLPFVKWSVFFLLLNHFWFYIGFLNETYGNAKGGVTHPLTLHQGLQSLWSILFNMSGYDQFLAGAYWFFRSLLVSSIVFLVGLKLAEGFSRLSGKHSQSALVLALTAIAFALWQTSDGLKVTGLAQGGYREIMGVFFIAAGFLYRQFELWLETPQRTAPLLVMDNVENKGGVVAIKAANTTLLSLQKSVRWLSSQPLVSIGISAVILGLLTVFPHPTMDPKANSFADVFWLALSGTVGFSFIYNLAKMLHRIKPLHTSLTYIGENTLYVFGFHLLAFKFVSMLKVGIYGLPWAAVGGHPVVQGKDGTWFWVLYTIFGIVFPLGFIWLARYCKERFAIDSYKTFFRICGILLWQAMRFTAKWTWFGLKYSSIKLWQGLRWAVVELFMRIYNFCLQFVDTVKGAADVSQDKEDLDDDDDEEDDEEEDDYVEIDDGKAPQTSL